LQLTLILHCEAAQPNTCNQTILEALQRALRAALLQAFYAIPDQRAFADHVRFNSLFRWFVGLSDIDERWDSDLYARLYDQWINDRELRQFIIWSFPMPGSPETLKCNQSLMPSKAGSTVTVRGPFTSISSLIPQIKEVMVALRFANPNGSEPPSLMTDVFRQQLRQVFPADVDPADEIRLRLTSGSSIRKTAFTGSLSILTPFICLLRRLNLRTGKILSGHTWLQ
jgi:hypothetical protein